MLASELRRLGRIAGMLIGLIALFWPAPRALSVPTYVGMDYGWSGAVYGSNFLPGVYNSTTTVQTMQDLQSKSINLCRVFVYTDLQGLASPVTGTPSQAFLNNIVDFVNTANRYGVAVEVTLFTAWDFVSYNSATGAVTPKSTSPSAFFRNVVLYSPTGPIGSVATALKGKRVFWDFCNEINNLAQYYDNNSKAMVDVEPNVGWYSVNSWIAAAKALIQSIVGTGQPFTSSINNPDFFTYDGYHFQYPVMSYSKSTNLTSDALNRFNLDFYDVHIYNNTGQVGNTNNPTGLGAGYYPGDTKPWFLGEFGPDNQTSNWALTPDPATLVNNFWNNASAQGFTTIMMWDYFDFGGATFQSKGKVQLSQLSSLAVTQATRPYLVPGPAAVGLNGNLHLAWVSSLNHWLLVESVTPSGASFFGNPMGPALGNGVLGSNPSDYVGGVAVGPDDAVDIGIADGLGENGWNIVQVNAATGGLNDVRTTPGGAIATMIGVGMDQSDNAHLFTTANGGEPGYVEGVFSSTGSRLGLMGSPSLVGPTPAPTAFFAMGNDQHGRLLTYSAAEPPHNQSAAVAGNTWLYITGSNWTTLMSAPPMASNVGYWVPLGVCGTPNNHTQVLWEGFSSPGIPEVGVWDIAPSGTISYSWVIPMSAGWYPLTIAACPFNGGDGNINIVFQGPNHTNTQWVVNPSTWAILDNVWL